MVSFDDVLDLLVETCESQPAFASVTRAVAVRDLDGHVRLALRIDVPASPPLDVGALETALAGALGPWFERPILVKEPVIPTARAARELGTLTANVLDRGQDWPEAGYIDPATGRRVQPAAGRWRKIEARLSKQAWTSSDPVRLPWALSAGMPAVATFYSFKGGVGRTTLLSAIAWRLARKNKRVVVVDLDVEAPGAGTLLGGTAQRGLLDLLLDHVAMGDFDLDSALSPASALDADSQSRVEVLGTGRLDAGYFEKLARLDFSVSGVLPGGGESPVEKALRALLYKLVRRTPRPDYILLDARAGLHDVAGLGLHGLAHVDVLVARASEQGYQGLDLTVESLARRRELKDQRFLVVHTFVPSVAGTREAVAVEKELSDRVYATFQRHVHTRMDPAEVPSPRDVGAHQPAIVRITNVLERPAPLASLEQTLLGDHFADPFDRFEILCKPET